MTLPNAKFFECSSLRKLGDDVSAKGGSNGVDSHRLKKGLRIAIKKMFVNKKANIPRIMYKRARELMIVPKSMMYMYVSSPMLSLELTLWLAQFLS